jgi:hypothetical protein
MNKMWSWASTAHYLVRAGRATINIQMPPGTTLKHITFHKCESTGDVILKGQLTAFNFVPPPYKEDGTPRTEATSGYAGDGDRSRTPEHH